MTIKSELWLLQEVKSHLQVIIILSDGLLYVVAGADIAEMAKRTFSDNYKENFLADWNTIFKAFPKPVIAAVNGFAVPMPIFYVTHISLAWGRLRAGNAM